MLGNRTTHLHTLDVNVVSDPPLHHPLGVQVGLLDALQHLTGWSYTSTQHNMCVAFGIVYLLIGLVYLLIGMLFLDEVFGVFGVWDSSTLGSLTATTASFNLIN